MSSTRLTVSVSGLSLDAGCGVQPRGSVNCDLYVNDVGHRAAERESRVIDLGRVKNFVLCDVQFLPFRSDVFEVVYSSHVIEHLEKPGLYFGELVRVCCGRVLLWCPFWLGDRMFNRENLGLHRWFFGKGWFYRVMAGLGLRGLVEYSGFRCFPCELVPLVKIPLELFVCVFKRFEGEKGGC